MNKKMDLIEALQALKEGKKVRHEYFDKETYLFNNRSNIISIHTADGCCDYHIGVIDLGDNRWKLYGGSILEREEKAYLEEVLEPIKHCIVGITKETVIMGSTDHLEIRLRGLSADITMSLPEFKKGTKYDDMIDGEEYTLEELGLFQD